MSTEDESQSYADGPSDPVSTRARDINGGRLVPGVNVDAVDIGAGLRRAASLGYSDATAQMVAQYALQRHARGEEEDAIRTWTHEYPRDLTSWYAILATAVTAAGGTPSSAGDE